MGLRERIFGSPRGVEVSEHHLEDYVQHLALVAPFEANEDVVGKDAHAKRLAGLLVRNQVIDRSMSVGLISIVPHSSDRKDEADKAYNTTALFLKEALLE